MAPQTPLHRGMKPTWGTVMLPGGCLLKAAPLEGAGGPLLAGLSPTEGAGGAPGPGPDPASGVPGGAGEGVLPAGAQENEDHPGGERSILGEPGRWGCLAGQAPTGCQAAPPNASGSREPIPAGGSCQLPIPALRPPATAALGEAPSLSRQCGSGQSWAQGSCSSSPRAHHPSHPGSFLAPDSSPEGSPGASTLACSTGGRVSRDPPRR